MVGGGDANREQAPDPTKHPGEKCGGDSETWVRVVRSTKAETPVSSSNCTQIFNKIALLQLLVSVQPVVAEKPRCRHRLRKPFRQFFATTMCMRT